MWRTGEGEAIPQNEFKLDAEALMESARLRWHGPAQHGPAQHGPAQHGPAQHGPAQHGPALVALPVANIDGRGLSVPSIGAGSGEGGGRSGRGFYLDTALRFAKQKLCWVLFNLRRNPR